METLSKQLTEICFIPKQPIYRIHEQSEDIAKKDLGLYPWFHLCAIGDYVIVWIWDTREIQDIIPISEFKKSKTTVQPAEDNHKELVVPKHLEKKVSSLLDKLKNSERHMKFFPNR